MTAEHACQVEIRMIGWSQYLPEMFPVVISMFDDLTFSKL